MGRGIAQVFAYAGHEVSLIDFKPRPAAEAEALLATGRDEISTNLGFLADLGVLDSALIDTIMGRIDFVAGPQAEAALAEADVIFEGVTEVREIKADAFARMCAAARPEAVIASTTSTMVVTELAELVTGPERFLNAHWLNPAYLIPLVEVSPSEQTAPEVIDDFIALLEAAGKVPVRCAASPGYIVPRIQALAMNEAARMVEEGVASAEDIDKAIRVGFGPRYATMGLIEFIDWGGGDILYYATRYLRQALDDPRFTSPDVVVRNMEEGKLGMHAGQGFYDFRDIDVEAYQRDMLTRFVHLLRHMNLVPPPAEE
jgi:3-hydroxybutyryl-CoA dehydrogenase